MDKPKQRAWYIYASNVGKLEELTRLWGFDNDNKTINKLIQLAHEINSKFIFELKEAQIALERLQKAATL